MNYDLVKKNNSNTYYNIACGIVTAALGKMGISYALGLINPSITPKDCDEDLSTFSHCYKLKKIPFDELGIIGREGYMKLANSLEETTNLLKRKNNISCPDMLLNLKFDDKNTQGLVDAVYEKIKVD